MDSALFEAVTDLEAVPQQADEEFAVPAEAPAPSAAADVVAGKQNLYFVRVPRPHVDDAPVKELQTKLSAVLSKLKEYNKKLAAKREEVAGLRGQVAVARSLKEEAAPEWQDKVNKLHELKDIRKGLQDEIATIKLAQSGVDVRSEEELDAKVAAMEAEIAHGQLELREEKQMVKEISKLKAQRDRVREIEGRKGVLTQLEGELVKVKAAHKELDTEVKALRGEREQAVGILQEIQEKLREVNDAISDLESERSEYETRKKELQEQIRAVQDESSGAMQEWRENRKLSLAVRDLVETGRLDEARAMCDEQVAAFMGRLLSDAAYRAEYTAGWAEQRKYVVSDLLPGSGVAAAPDARDRGGRAGKSAAEAPRGEPKVQGAVKAAALIEQLMAQAQATVAAQRGSQPAAPVETEESAESGDGEAPEANGGASAAADANGGAYRPPAAARAVPGATEELLAAPKRSGKPKAAVASVAKAMAEVPVLPDIEFEVPAVVTGREEQSAGLTPEEVKAQIREENRRKAAEAEARKKRREEAAVRKRQLAEAAAVRKAEEPAVPAAPEPAVPAAASAAEPAASGDDAPTASAPTSKAPKPQKPVQRKPKNAAIVKPGPVVLKRPLREEPGWRKALKALGLDNGTKQAVAIAAAVLLIVVLLWIANSSSSAGRQRVIA